MTDPNTPVSPVSPIPPGMHTLTPHIVCRNAAAAMDFYARAFGAVEMFRLPGPDGRLMHGHMTLGDSALMLTDEYVEHGCLGAAALKGSPVILHLYVTDADAAFDRAVTAGATPVMPVADMFWGDRYGQVEDPFGHRWSIATQTRRVSPEEILAAAAQGCGGV